MNSLSIMVAPNGARKSKDDHPGVPITTEEIAIEAAACAAAGAQAIHLHVRDAQGRHSLDPARSAIAAVRKAAGVELIAQITTESAGRFSPLEQIQTVRVVCPEAVSVAVKELVPDYASETLSAKFYLWAYRDRFEPPES
jgi:3-keto-5-aminohexanoate cleavage enzyme